jgi:ParB/RepB/Spo0J family partition protein
LNAPTDPSLLERPAIAGAVFLPLALCQPSPYNPRKRFDQAKLDELGISIAKVGVMQPITARPIPGAKTGQPLYEIVAGERRWRGSNLVADTAWRKKHEQAIGTARIAAIEAAGTPMLPAVVRELSDFEARELAMIENKDRENLHAIEEAEGYAALLRKPGAKEGYDVDELAARFNVSRRYVYGRLSLLKLAPAVRDACYDDKLHVSVALLIAAYPQYLHEEQMQECLQGWGGEPFSQRQAAKHLRDRYTLSLRTAVFDIKDASLIKKAGACTTCPKRTGANPDLFGDAADGPDVCTDAKCFDKKKTAHGEKVIEQAEKDGKTVLTGDAAKKVMPHGEWSLSNTGHLNLDKPAEDLTGSRKTLRTLLGDDFAGAVLLKAEHQELPLTVAKQTDVKAALKAKGLLQPSTKSQPGVKGKKLTADDIKKQRSERINELLEERLPDAFAKAMEKAGEYGFPSDSEQWMRYLTNWLWQGSCYLNQDVLARAITGKPTIKGALVDSLNVEQLCTMSLLLILMDATGGHSSKDTTADALAKDIKFDLPGLRASITDEVDAQIRDEIDALKAPVASKKPTAKASKAAKPEPLTPEAALAAAVARAPEGGKGAAKPTSTAKKKAKATSAGKGEVKDQTDDAAAPQGPAAPAEQKDEAATPPRVPAVGERWRVRLDAKGRGKTAGREGTVDNVGEGTATLRWGVERHAIGVYLLSEIEFVSADVHTPAPASSPVISSVAAWPFPKGAKA